MKSISIRVDDIKLQKLDEILDFEKKNRSTYINEILNERIELYDWQVEQIKAGLEQSERGEYSKDIEMIKLLLDNE